MRWESIEASADRNFLACVASVKGGGGGGKKEKKEGEKKAVGFGAFPSSLTYNPPSSVINR